MTELPATVTAAYITAIGPAENIRLGELPMPSLGPTDVSVRAEVVAVNHVDTFVRSGAYQTALPLPFIVGRDVVGVVASAEIEVEQGLLRGGRRHHARKHFGADLLGGMCRYSHRG